MEVIIASPLRRVGGSGTEMIHNVDLLRQHNVKVTLVSGLYGDTKAIQWAKDIGCEIIDWPTDGDWSFAQDKLVVSHGQTKFLLDLHKIKKHTNKITYITSMWHINNVEQQAIMNGQLRDIVYVSEAQCFNHLTQYSQWGIETFPARRLGYIPYLNPFNSVQPIRRDKKPHDYFGIGRVSRPDPLKFPKDVWKTFEKLKVDKKKILINSWDIHVLQKCGMPTKDLDVKLFYPYEIETSDFLNQVDLIFQQQGGSGESFGRYVIEAMAAGVPLVLEKGDNAFSEIGTSGEDFILGENTEDMVTQANELMANSPKRNEMIEKAYETFLNKNGNSDNCWNFWEALLNE